MFEAGLTSLSFSRFKLSQAIKSASDKILNFSAKKLVINMRAIAGNLFLGIFEPGNLL
jgi:hypothetical protein